MSIACILTDYKKQETGSHDIPQYKTIDQEKAPAGNTVQQLFARE
ncbi:hypothetical protein [Limnobacter sp.]